MRKLSLKRGRLLTSIDNYKELYSYQTKKEQLVVSSGVMNFIWNSWNNFWRDYWLAHIIGGSNFDNSYISPLHSNYNEWQACHYLLVAAGKRSNHSAGQSINGSHQEITWGSEKTITDIATYMSANFPRMNYVLGVLSNYQTELKHFQQIRNTFIHMNNDNINKLNTVRSYYSFSQDQDLIDILEARHLQNSEKCFDHMIDSMKGMLLNI